MAEGGDKRVIVGVKGVKYGLQLQNKQKIAPTSGLAAFSTGGSGSDEEDVQVQVAAQQAKNLRNAKVRMR